MVQVATPSTTPASSSGHFESRKDFAPPAPQRGNHQYWQAEIDAACQRLSVWQAQADKIHQRYLDARQGQYTVGSPNAGSQPGFRLNLFHANVSTLTDMLYSNLPEVDVSRRHADPNDDVGRVAAVMLERVLANDIADHPDTYNSIIQSVLQDRLIPGLGVARVRYEATFQEVTVQAVTDINGQEVAPAYTDRQLVSEQAPLDYYHWRDVLWGWSRSWDGVEWVAFRTYPTKDDVQKRFGKEIASQIELKQRTIIADNKKNDAPDDTDLRDPWVRAEIWEIWDKRTREVIWVSPSIDQTLDRKPDPLRLKGFFPCPRFMIANPTTTLFHPTPDFHLAQDLYNEVDKIQTRIAVITEACKVVGLYDAEIPEVQRMFKEGNENDLIPVARWAMFAEKGGLQGAIDWFPIEEVVNALVNLRQLRDETIALLYQITGMSDIMRGQLDHQYEGVGQSEIKAQFGSVRIQGRQEELARFVTDLMSLKAEVVCKHFEPQTIANLANVSQLPADQQLVPAALQLLGNFDQAEIKIVVKADSLAMADYALRKRERIEYLGGLSEYMKAIAPLAQEQPASVPFLLQMLQWGLAGLRGGDEAEGIIDQAIQATMQAMQQEQEKPEQPPPEVQREQVKIQGELQTIQAQLMADIQRRQADMDADIRTKQAESQMKVRDRMAELHADIALIRAKMQAAIMQEQATSAINVEQAVATAEAETQKDVVGADLELALKEAETQLNILEQQQAAAIEVEKLDASAAINTIQSMAEAAVKQEASDDSGNAETSSDG